MAKLNNELTVSVTNNFRELANKSLLSDNPYNRYDMYVFLSQTSLTNYNKQLGQFVPRTMELLFERSMYKARAKAEGLGYSTIELNHNYEDIKQLAYIRCMEYLQALEDMQERVYLFDAVKPTSTVFYSEERDENDELIPITIYDCLPPIYIYFGLMNVCMSSVNHHLRSKRTCTLVNTYTNKENIALETMETSDTDYAVDKLMNEVNTSAMRHGFTDTSEFIEYMRSALTPMQYRAITKAIVSDSDTSRTQLARARKRLASDEYFATMAYEDKLQACHDLLNSGGALSDLLNIKEALRAM